ncbi:response regulator transcription factor [Microbacterium sp. NPDC057650]|uniref:helix-turn-helix transcriptional regulator n=1 Tax=unclassified Microbacterium TaxID=2609290 RepID=UPI00366F4450
MLPHVRPEVTVNERIPRLLLPSHYDLPGIDDDSRTLYAHLASVGPLPLEQVDSPALRTLTATGLAVVHAGSVDIVPPAGPLQEIADQHTQRAVAAQLAIDDLMAVWRAARGQEVGVEVLSGPSASREFDAHIAQARREILALSIGPRAGMTIEPAHGVLDALARGVGVQVVYHSRLFENESALAVTTECVAAGEQARVLPRVPVNLVIADDCATLNVSYDNDEPIHLAVMRNRRLVESWRVVFQTFWQLALPFDPGSALESVRHPAPDEHRELVRLLSLGITDRAIARELGVSERTVGRRVTALQEHLGVDTRFQLGLQLAMQGWV